MTAQARAPTRPQPERVWIRAANAAAWAIGWCDKRGFHVRRIVWGRALAREEKRDGEIIRRAVIMVSDT